MYDLHQVGLVRHHFVDVLVGARDFVEHTLVLATNHAARLRLQVFDAELLLRGVAAHPAPGTVRARMKAFGGAASSHDVAASAHAAGNDAELTGARTNRTLSRQPHRLAEVGLALDVIVMAVHRSAGDLERRQVAPQRVEDDVHHLRAVGGGVVLRPIDGLHVIVEVSGALGEVREIRVRQMNVVALKIFLRELDEVAADRVADAAAAGVQHHPGLALFVEAKLDEVVSAAKRAHLVRPARMLANALLHAGVLFENLLQPALEWLDRMLPRVAMLAEAHGHLALDRRKDLEQLLLGKIIRRQGEAPRHHAAADVHADRGRNDRLDGRDHRAHRRADAQMHIRHGGDVVVDDRQRRDVDELLARRRLELAGIDLDGNTAFADFLDDRHTLLGLFQPEPFHGDVGVGRGPADEEQPVQRLDAREEPQVAGRYDIAIAKRRVRFGGKVQRAAEGQVSQAAEAAGSHEQIHRHGVEHDLGHVGEERRKNHDDELGPRAHADLWQDDRQPAQYLVVDDGGQHEEQRAYDADDEHLQDSFSRRAAFCLRISGRTSGLIGSFANSSIHFSGASTG